MNRMRENRKRTALLTLTFGLFGLLALPHAMRVYTLNDLRQQRDSDSGRPPMNRNSATRPTSASVQRQMSTPTSGPSTAERRNQMLARLDNAGRQPMSGNSASASASASRPTSASGQTVTPRSDPSTADRRTQNLAWLDNAGRQPMSGNSASASGQRQTVTPTSGPSTADTPTSDPSTADRRAQILAQFDKRHVTSDVATSTTATQREDETMKDALRQIQIREELEEIDEQLRKLANAVTDEDEDEDVWKGKELQAMRELKVLQLEELTSPHKSSEPKRTLDKEEAEQFLDDRIQVLGRDVDTRRMRQRRLDILERRPNDRE